mmetsp:Transcript_46031/g.99967  ORF Transcript_46031/g.99967 Transcript_46031/m.99967 type:complete len:514 (+) Transcript_46031:111-1652(+)
MVMGPTTASTMGPEAVSAEDMKSQGEGNSRPAVRSASVLVPISGGELLVFGGEASLTSERSTRTLSDVWTLSPPASDGRWQASSCPTGHSWRPWKCSAVANENVPTARSNHVALACGDHLLVFGGWAADGNTPLSHPELLHLETACWTHCSTVEPPPPPRGNPTAVYTPSRHLAVIYGGWDKVQRLDDVWCLDMESWRWHRGASARDSEQPSARTDHTAVLWRVDAQEERMLVFAGSTLKGASDELWSLDISRGSPEQWSWLREVVEGPAPSPRTSHAAAITGEGASASLVICGGQNGAFGSGAVGILADAWVLRDLGSRERAWSRCEWRGTFPLQRCRHSMVIVPSASEANGGSGVSSLCALVYGGFDGVSTIDEHHSLFVAPLDLLLENAAQERGLENGKGQERWTSEIPVTEADLEENVRAKASSSRLPFAMAKALHRHAMALDPPRDTYIDPDTGYSVFTQAYLQRRPCCGNGCRHCPHGHINVPEHIRDAKKRQAAIATGSPTSDLEW